MAERHAISLIRTCVVSRYITSIKPELLLFKLYNLCKSYFRMTSKLLVLFIVMACLLRNYWYLIINLIRNGSVVSNPASHLHGFDSRHIHMYVVTRSDSWFVSFSPWTPVSPPHQPFDLHQRHRPLIRCS